MSGLNKRAVYVVAVAIARELAKFEKQSRHQKYLSQVQAMENAAQAAIAACHAEEMLGTLRILIAAKDEKEQYGNTPHYELLKAEGWTMARALLAKLDGQP